jgi:hypothetical protein
MSVSLAIVNQAVHLWNVFCFAYSSSANFVFVSYCMIIFGTATNVISKRLGDGASRFRTERNMQR